MMRSLQTRLYSFAAPLMLLGWPIVGFSVSEVGDYARGDEFRTFLGEIIIQIFTGLSNAIITGLTALLFGLFGGGA